LVATELATNLMKHAREGLVAINEFVDADGSGIELIALDKGPGIADVARCLVDGFSTAGSHHPCFRQLRDLFATGYRNRSDGPLPRPECGPSRWPRDRCRHRHLPRRERLRGWLGHHER